MLHNIEGNTFLSSIYSIFLLFENNNIKVLVIDSMSNLDLFILSSSFSFISVRHIYVNNSNPIL